MALSFKEKFTNYLFASYPFLYIQTHEEGKVCGDILSATEAHSDLCMWEWDVITGMSKVERQKEKLNRRAFQNTAQPQQAIEHIKKLPSERQIIVLKDFHPFFQNPAIVRAVRNLLEELKNKGNIVVFVSPVMSIPPELEKEIQYLDYHLPDEKALEERLNYVIESAKQDAKSEDAKKKLSITADICREAVEAAKGMTASEAENAYTLSIVTNKAFNKSFVHTVFDEKIVQVKKNSLLTYLEPDVDFSQIGGLVGLKNWIGLRAKAYEEKARVYGLPFPKGVLLAGIPGCGKTLLAKATAKELGFPLFQLDIGSLFGKLVGESEENFRKVIKTVDGLGRCVLFIDEIEKGLNRSAVSGQGDTGTSSRSFATLLSWLSDRRTPVFVIGTSNKFMDLPTELIRKGRFDELFWIDLPDEAERADIFSVLLKRYCWDPSKFKLNVLGKESEGFTGAEIEDIIKSTMFACYADNARPVKTEDLLNEIKTIIPQSKINEADIGAMRLAAKGKLRIAGADGSVKDIERNENVSRKVSVRS